MSRFLVASLSACAAVTIAACGRASERAADTAAPAAATPTTGARSADATAPTPTVSISQVEGTWHGKTIAETGDSVRATWTFNAPADTSKWVVQFTNGPKVPVHVVAIAGDSIAAQMGPYKSVSVKGQMVTTRFVNRVHGDTLVGTYESRFGANSDSVRRGRLVGTRSR